MPAAAIAAVVALVPGSVVALLGAGLYLLITARQRVPVPSAPAVTPRQA